MRLFQLTQVWFGLLQFTQMFMQIWMNLFYFTQIFPIVPKFEWNCFNCPNSIEAFGIYPNVSVLYPNYIEAFVYYPIGIKMFEVDQNWIKLFEVTQIGMKLFHLAQIWMELMPFRKVDFVCWNLPKFFQFMEIFLISHKLEWSCSNLLKFDWGCWNLPKWF